MTTAKGQNSWGKIGRPKREKKRATTTAHKMVRMGWKKDKMKGWYVGEDGRMKAEVVEG
jgi:hypothetical protein